MGMQGMETEHLRWVASGLQQRLDQSLHAIPIIQEVKFRTVFPVSAQSRQARLVSLVMSTAASIPGAHHQGNVSGR